jgi:hypothetical protein
MSCGTADICALSVTRATANRELCVTMDDNVAIYDSRQDDGPRVATPPLTDRISITRLARSLADLRPGSSALFIGRGGSAVRVSADAISQVPS